MKSVSDTMLDYYGVTTDDMGETVNDHRFRLLKETLAKSSVGLVTNDSPSNIRRIIESAGNQMGSVHFIKRSTGTLRKMSYRLHVTNPKFAKKPSGHKVVNDVANDQMTVFDVNKPVKKDGEVIGRGAWRTIPLENVCRIVAGGKTYIISPNFE